jgi:arylsulfatase A-like enzyme
MYDPRAVPPWGSFAERFEDKPYIQRQQLLNWGIEEYGWEDWAPIVARYYGIISQTDDAIGRVLGALDALGVADNTIVVYTTDHGDLCGGHRMMDKHFVLYDDVVRVPLVIRWPGRITPGLRPDAFVHNLLDLPPTLLEAAGLPPGEALQGRSLLSLLAGEAVPDWRDAAVSTYNGLQFGLYTQRMIRTARWKYVWNTTDVDELYDLAADPDELTNRVHEPGRGELLRELRARLYHELDRVGDALVANTWMRQQLLGSRKL